MVAASQSTSSGLTARSKADHRSYRNDEETLKRVQRASVYSLGIAPLSLQARLSRVEGYDRID